MSQSPAPPSQLIEYLALQGIEAEFIAPGVPMPTVTLAAQAAGVPEDQILKTLVFVDDRGTFVVAVASGNGRVDRNRLARIAGVNRLRPASPDDVRRLTGFPAGGVAPLGLPSDVTVVVDRMTSSLTTALGGGGDENILMSVRLEDVIRCNNATVADIREQSRSV